MIYIPLYVATALLLGLLLAAVLQHVMTTRGKL